MPEAPIEVDVRVLGPLEVWIRGAPVAVGGHKQRTLLAMLALHANQVVSTDRLIDVLWGERPPPSADGTPRASVSRMRATMHRALGDGAQPLIEGRPPGYVLSLGADGTDASRFEMLAAAGRAALPDHPAEAARTLRAALTLWRGPAYAKCQEIARLDELRLAALGSRIDADLVMGQTAGLVAELQALTREHPVREAFHAQLLRTLTAEGRRAEALLAYGRAVDALQDELGVGPGAELRGLHASLLEEEAGAVRDRRPEMRAANVRLPSVLTRFVGRQREVAEVIALTRRQRLVTLTGAGGSGKTRLALEVAADVGTRPGQRVLFVELAGAGPGSVKAAIALAAGVRAEGAGRRPIDDVVAEALAGQPTLLVLDNCEHVITEAAGVAASLLSRCDALVVLATSRQPLAISGEQVWRMPPLSLPDAGTRSMAAALQSDAVRLFVDRARTARADATFGDGDAAAVVLICRRLDGLPLAIELAAARVTVLTPDEIADRLDDSLRMLRGGPRDGPDRHRAVETALDWSYRLLDRSEQQLLARLSVFRGSFTHDAVIAVCGWGDLASDHLLDGMSALVDKSLVVATLEGTSSSFRLLETVRQYSAERAEEAGQLAELRRRHAAYYAARVKVTAPRLRGPDPAAALRWLDQHGDDIHAALAWLEQAAQPGGLLDLAAVLWLYWDYRFGLTEGRDWLSRALRAPAGEDGRSRALALAGAAKLAFMDDDPAAAGAACQEGLDVALELGLPSSRAPFLVILADLARCRGDDEEVIQAFCKEAAALFRAQGDLSGEADALRVVAYEAMDRGDLVAAERWGDRCVELWDRCGDSERSAGIRLLLGNLFVERGQLPEAERLHQESLLLFDRAKEPWGTSQAICSLAALANLQRQPLRAMALATDSLERQRRLGEHRGVAKSLKVIADAGLQLGRLEQADRAATEALAGFRQCGFGRDVEGALLSVAAIALRRGQLGRAGELCDEALVPYRLGGRRGMAAVALTLLGVVGLRRHDLAGAARALDEGRALAELDPHRGVIAATLAMLLERDDLDVDVTSPLLGVPAE